MPKEDRQILYIEVPQLCHDSQYPTISSIKRHLQVKMYIVLTENRICTFSHFWEYHKFKNYILYITLTNPVSLKKYLLRKFPNK